jgi:translation initiation factor IF-2
MTTTIEKYKEALLAHDWGYEFSDSYKAWTQGYAERKILEEMAKMIDPDRVIWNECAPDGFKRERTTE